MHSRRQNTSIVSACVFEVLDFEVLPNASVLLDVAWDLTGLKNVLKIKVANHQRGSTKIKSLSLSDYSSNIPFLNNFLEAFNSFLPYMKKNAGSTVHKHGNL